nr:double-strand break repair protein MRE11-like [Penaeus vannamei]
MILFKKERKRKKKNETGIDKEAMDAVFAGEDVAETRVEDLVEQYFSELQDYTQKLFLLSERGLAKGVNTFVEKDDRDAISTVFQHQVKKTVDHILSGDGDIDEENILDAIITYREERLTKNNPQLEEQEAQAALSSTTRERRRVSDDDDAIWMTLMWMTSALRQLGNVVYQNLQLFSFSEKRIARRSWTRHDGSPKVSQSYQGHEATRGEKQKAATRNQVMESFSRARTAASSRKGIVYDSDDD